MTVSSQVCFVLYDFSFSVGSSFPFSRFSLLGLLFLLVAWLFPDLASAANLSLFVVSVDCIGRRHYASIAGANGIELCFFYPWPNSYGKRMIIALMTLQSWKIQVFPTSISFDFYCLL